MDSQDIRTLKILEAIDQDQQPSQRDLAKGLNISLGLANSFIKRLAQKGYFKIRTIPKNRVKYILTPHGAAEKTRLTYAYIQYSYHYYKEARQKLRELFFNFVEMGVSEVVFYGAGDLAEIAFLSLQETDINLLAVVDDLKEGRKFFQYMILPPNIITSYNYDKLIVTSISAQKEILGKLKVMNIPMEGIVTLN